MDIGTCDLFWDCECDIHYIHRKEEKSCPVCGAEKDNQPEYSRYNELNNPYNWYHNRGMPI